MMISVAATPIQDTPEVGKVITAELVAKTIAGIPLIGEARRTLEQQGWTATITANRITVNGAVEAHLISSNGHGWWQVYAMDGTPPVWTIGAHCEDASNRTGCVD